MALVIARGGVAFAVVYGCDGPERACFKGWVLDGDGWARIDADRWDAVVGARIFGVTNQRARRTPARKGAQ